MYKPAKVDFLYTEVKINVVVRCTSKSQKASWELESFPTVNLKAGWWLLREDRNWSTLVSSLNKQNYNRGRSELKKKNVGGRHACVCVCTSFCKAAYFYPNAQLFIKNKNTFSIHLHNKHENKFHLSNKLQKLQTYNWQMNKDAIAYRHVFVCVSMHIFDKKDKLTCLYCSTFNY